MATKTKASKQARHEETDAEWADRMAERLPERLTPEQFRRLVVVFVEAIRRHVPDEGARLAIRVQMIALAPTQSAEAIIREEIAALVAGEVPTCH